MSPWIQIVVKRALAAWQAARCEESSTKSCRCRCGGRFHGARRGAVADLPDGDPHRPAERVREERA